MNYTEVEVAAVGDLADGEMKQFAAGETNILLACVESITRSVRRVRTTAHLS